MKKTINLIFACVLTGCVSLPQDAFVVTPKLLEQRQLETKRYEGINEQALISACSNVLQDLGFTLENSETKLGLITASKQRDATNAGEIALAIVAAFFGGGISAVSKDQTIRVSLVTRPVIDSSGKAMEKNHFVRITFQRIVRKTDNSTYSETLNDTTLYQEFYDKLSKSIFLEANKI